MTARQSLPAAWQEEHDHDACLADAISVATVSYTHLTLPTNREV